MEETTDESVAKSLALNYARLMAMHDDVLCEVLKHSSERFIVDMLRYGEKRYNNLVEYIEKMEKESQKLMNKAPRGFWHYAINRAQRDVYEDLLDMVRGENNAR